MTLTKLYEREMQIQEELSKRRLRPNKWPGDIKIMDKLEQELIDVSNKIRKLKKNG